MNDPEIRKSLVKSYFKKFKSENCLLLEELAVLNGSSIADIVLISKIFNQAFEIKSARDSLSRLEKQINDYLQVFDYVTVITQASHYDDVERIVPSFVGIFLIYDDESFDYVRKAAASPYLKKEKMVKLLWKNEIYSFLRSKGYSKISHLRISKLEKILCENFSLNEIKSILFEGFKSRSNWKTRLV